MILTVMRTIKGLSGLKNNQANPINHGPNPANQSS
jgi:hypothetical protein